MGQLIGNTIMFTVLALAPFQVRYGLMLINICAALLLLMWAVIHGRDWITVGDCLRIGVSALVDMLYWWLDLPFVYWILAGWFFAGTVNEVVYRIKHGLKLICW